MVSEPSWRKHLSQEWKMSLLSYMKIRAFWWWSFSTPKPSRKVWPPLRISLALSAHLFSGWISRKMKVLKIENWTYQEVHLAETSSLVCLDLRKSNFCSFKLDLRISGLVFWYLWYSGTSSTLVFWYFWYFVKLGFHFPRDLATEKVRWECQSNPCGRVHFSGWF